MNEYKHTFADDTQESFEVNGASGWRPVIAHPFYVGFGLKKAKCGCGRVFKNIEDFRAHYVYMAVWENESNYIPELIAQERKNGANLHELKRQERLTDLKPSDSDTNTRPSKSPTPGQIKQMEDI